MGTNNGPTFHLIVRRCSIVLMGHFFFVVFFFSLPRLSEIFSSSAYLFPCVFSDFQKTCHLVPPPSLLRGEVVFADVCLRAPGGFWVALSEIVGRNTRSRALGGCDEATTDNEPYCDISLDDSSGLLSL